MNIKTITSTEGVNEVDFGSNASRFYWFQNLGTTTVHVSGKADITAGSDGVAELAAGDSVCIETLSGKVYVLGAGKVQIHNTGDKFCPFKNAPVAGGGEAVDAYTKSESDAKYAQKTDIPSTLPANGGNADTVGGLHANDFIQIVDFGGSETDTKTAIGQLGKTTIYRCTKWTDYPAEFIDSQGTLITVNYAGTGTVGTDPLWCTQIIVNPRSGNKMFIRYMDATSVSDWKEISTTPIKSTTVSGTTDANGNLMLWAASENKIPICAILTGYCSSIFHYAPDGNYYLGVSDTATQAYSPNVSVDGTVYYIEQG